MPLYRYLLLIFLFIISLDLFAQEEQWDVYMAQYEKGIGSTMLNMAFKNEAPDKNLPFVLITGVTYKNCSADGMPEKNEFDNLYKISDSVAAVVKRLKRNSFTGTFTYQCERLDYYYINDTTGIRSALEQLYASRFADYKPYINIKQDKQWEAYLDFLYPNGETFEFMQNQKVVSGLSNAGDKLDKPRKVDHWIYFVTAADRECFIGYISKHNFKIELKEKTNSESRPFKLQISRTDKIDVSSISAVTIDLRKEAKKCNGDYDGWETFVIK